MTDVFISYSRRNTVFARRLLEQLNQSGKNSWVDWEGIPLISPNWWGEIKRGIEGADSFLFITSPDSMASVVCNMELNYAIRLGKRIIPLIYQEVQTDEAFASIADFTPDDAMKQRLGGQKPLKMAQANWQRLSHINWIYFRDSDDFDASYQKLISAVDTNLNYVRAHTRYLIRAQEWERETRREDLLLFGEEIDRAEAWLKQGDAYHADTKSTNFNPPPLKIQRRYVEVSRKRATTRKWVTRTVGASILLLVVFIGITLKISRDAQAQAAIANEQVIEGQVTLGAINTEVAFAQATVTRAYVLNDVMAVFANTIREVNNPYWQISEMDTLIAKYPDEAEVWKSRGAIYVSQEDYLSAIEDFNLALELYPDDPFSLTSRGDAYRILEDYENAFADFDRVIEIDPFHPNAFNNRGLIYNELGDYEQALDDFNQALEIDQDKSKPFVNRAITYRNLGNYEQALADYASAEAIAPYETRIYTNRGVLYAMIGQFPEAIAEFTRSIEINPKNPDYFYNRGIAYYYQNDYESALKDFQQALIINPFYVDGLLYVGLIYHETEKYHDAIAIYDRIIEIEPENSFAFNNRGRAYHLLTQYEDAIPNYQLSITYDPNNAQAYNNLGRAYYTLGDNEQAFIEYNRAIEIDPELVDAINNRGLIYYHNKDYTQALQDYDHALALSPGYALTLTNRGRVYYELGDYQKALDDYNQSIANNPNLHETYYYRALTNATVARTDPNIDRNLIQSDLEHYIANGGFVNNDIRLQLLRDFGMALP